MQCSTCGTTLSPASTYCSACGTSAGAPGSPDTPSPADELARDQTNREGQASPPRAQTAFYGRYGPRGNGAPKRTPPLLAGSPTLQETPPLSAGASAVQAPPLLAGALELQETANAQLSLDDDQTKPETADAEAILPLVKSGPRPLAGALGRPVTGRLIALGAALLLIALLAELGTYGYRTYQRNQAEQQAAHQATATTGAFLHATATANAQASATAQAILLNDPLTTNVNGWNEMNGTAFFQNGQYHLHNTDPTKTLNSYYEQRAFDDFKLQISVTAYSDANPTSDVPYAYGIVLRADPTLPANKYVFFVSPAGIYNFARHDAGTFENNGWADLVATPFGTSGAIHAGKGATNTLTILAEGNRFTLFINGQQVEVVTDNSGAPYTSGWIGVMVEGGDMEAGFSDLELHPPGN